MINRTLPQNREHEAILSVARPDYIIAIDPDVDKNGVATLHSATRLLETQSLEFAPLLDYIQNTARVCNQEGKTLIVLVEAGWLNKGNWHGRSTDNARISSAKGNATGRNHEVGRKLVECIRHYGVEVIEQKPLKKTWKGADRKITHAELAAFTSIKGRTNQEERDAALIAWSFAGLTIGIGGGKGHETQREK